MARKKAKAKAKPKKLKPQNPDNPARLITPPFRVSFPHVFQPNPRQTDKEQYDICMLFPKDTNLDHINAAINAVVDEKCKGKAKGLHMPIRDGDTDPAFEDYQESHEGMHVLSARTTFKPGLVDKNLEDIIDPGDFYSGCWARASITAFHYDTAGNKGISFSLNNLQKLKDDDPFTAAGMKAAGEFGDADDPEDWDDEEDEEDTEEESESDEYEVDDDGFAIDEDGEWIVDEDDNYLNADGVAVDEDCEPLEDEEEDEEEDDEEEEDEDDEEEEEAPKKKKGKKKKVEEDEDEDDEEEEDDEDW